MYIAFLIIIAVVYIFIIFFPIFNFAQHSIVEDIKCMGNTGFSVSQLVIYLIGIIALLTLFIPMVQASQYGNDNSAFQSFMVFFFLLILTSIYAPIILRTYGQYLFLTPNRVVARYKLGLLTSDRINLTIDKIDSVSIENRIFNRNIVIGVGGVNTIRIFNVLNADEFEYELNEQIDMSRK